MSAKPPSDTPRFSSGSNEGVLPARGRMSFGLLARLAVADLWHERTLTACVVVALTAVLAPLLILFSLKYGLVETLRTRLVNDPRNREIRPEQGHTFAHAQVEEIRRLVGVRFVVPNTRSISSSVDISLAAGSKESLDADLLPTGPGDPLLEENGARVPEEGECVLSHRAWKTLAPQGGDLANIYIEVGRVTGKQKREQAGTTLKVIGVAQERATDHIIVFTPLEFLEKVETWRDGRAVPSLKWDGGSAEATGVTDGVIVAMPRALEDHERTELPLNAPWISEITPLTPQEMDRRMTSLPEGSSHFYEMSVSSKRLEAGVDNQAIQALRRSLPEEAGNIFAQCRPLSLEIGSLQGGPSKRYEFQVEPLLVNQPVRRTYSTPTRPAPSPPPLAVAKQSPPTPQVETPTVPKAIPLEPPQIVLPQLPVQQFDLRSFQNQLKPPAPPAPPPTQRTPDTPGKGSPGGRAPTKPKTDRSTGGVSTCWLMPQAPPLFRYIQAKKQTSPPKNAKSAPPATAKPTPSAPVPKAPEIRRANATAGETIPPKQTPAASAPPLVNPAPATPKPPPAPVLISATAEATTPPVKPERIIFLPAAEGVTDGTIAQATFQSPFGPIRFPVTIRNHSGTAWKIPQSLAGILRLGMDRGIAYEDSTSEFVLSRRGYPALRIVAHSIDDVETIANHMASMQIGVMTAASRIRDLKELDRYTSYVFLLVAVVGLTGAVGSLLASLIAAVERKRRSLGVLRLLGLRRRTLFRLPFYQSTIVVSLSVGLAVLAWRYVTRIIIEITTASDYLRGEAIQVLPVSYLWASWGGAIAIAAAASFIAGLRVMRVDPSEAIRDE